MDEFWGEKATNFTNWTNFWGEKATNFTNWTNFWGEKGTNLTSWAKWGEGLVGKRACVFRTFVLIIIWLRMAADCGGLAVDGSVRMNAGDEAKRLLLFDLLARDEGEARALEVNEEARRWALAFEAWMAEREQRLGRKQRWSGENAWRQFLGLAHLAPWEVRREDLEGWLDYQMEEFGARPTTALRQVKLLSNFFYFCEERGVCKANPAARLRTPQAEAFSNCVYLYQEEAAALLGTVDRETSVVGKRDYALLALQLESGQTPARVRELRWGQLEVEGRQAWVSWKRGRKARREALGQACWEAMADYLEASGRMGQMKAPDFVFAPLAEKDHEPTGRAEEWEAGRAISAEQMRRALGLYAQWAGLKVEGLRLVDLRFTAMVQRLQAGMDEKEVVAWMGVNAHYPVRRHLLQAARKPVSAERLEAARQALGKGAYPRQAPGFQEGNLAGLKHGYGAQRLPQAEVAARLAAPMGFDQAIARLEVIMERAFELVMQTDSERELMRLLEVYGRAVGQLSGALKAQKALGVEDEMEGSRRVLKQAIENVLGEMKLMEGGQMVDEEEDEDEEEDIGWSQPG
ncbi:MAG: tyrosine-type recombinase/integrase [Chloroflexota bacterium]